MKRRTFLSFISAMLPLRLFAKSRKPAEPFIFDCFIHQAPETGPYGIGVVLRAADGTLARQAVITPHGCSAAEVGAALEKLGRFLQNPDERMVMGCQVLTGSELNAGEKFSPAPIEQSIRMALQHNPPPEFGEVIEKHFWELV